MTLHERQQWMFRLSIVVGLLAAVPAIAFWTGHTVPMKLLLVIVIALMAAGISAMVLGLLHMRALGRHRRTRR